METSPTVTWGANCPGPEELSAFHLGKLPEKDLEAVAAHLAGCPRCRSALEVLAPEGDTLIAGLRGSTPPEPLLAEPEYQSMEAAARAIVIGPSSSATRTLVGSGEPAGASAAAPALTQLGSYQILARLGQGGMGTVYKAWHVRLKRPVALKTLPAGRFSDPRAVARFHREMEAVGRLDHPHIIRATDAGEAGGVHFLVMDFVEGFDLSRLVQVHGPLSVADACELVRQAALGLQYAHEHGRVHRDVKPSNLMVTPAGQVKVLDLGLALLYGQPAGDEELTAEGQAMGTADFMAPEQGVDAHRVDIRADVYSLGCTLYKLLAGQAPFGDDRFPTPLQKLVAHAQVPPPPIRQHRPEVPEPLAAVLDRLLAKDPAGRYATPGEAAAALQPFTAGADLPALVAAAWAEAASGSETARTAPSGKSAGDTGAADPHASTITASANAPPPAAPATALSSGRPVAPVAAPPSWRRRWPLYAAGVLLLAGVGATLLFVLSRLPGRVPAPSQPTTIPPELARQEPVLHPEVKYNLLEQRPVELEWPTASGNSRWTYERQSAGLWVTADSVGLLGLGRTENADYEAEVTIQQLNDWGGAGIFFGYHKGQIDGRPGTAFQYVELVQGRLGKTKGTFSLQRNYTILRDSGGGSSSTRIGVVSIPPPDLHPQRLGIVVGKQGLEHVRWNGNEVADLTDVSPTALVHYPFTEADFQGQLGVFNNRSTSVYHRFDYLFHERR